MSSSVSYNNNDAVPEQLLAEASTPTVTVTPAPFEAGAEVSLDEGRRPQAGPLPRKRGEIGFQEGLHGVSDAESTSQASNSSVSLPARHPADRENSPVSNRRDSSSNEPSPNEPPRSPSRADSTNTISTTTTTSKRRLISFLNPKRIPTIAGLRVTTLAIFLIQLAVFGATLAGWILIVQHMQKGRPAPSGDSAPSSPSGTGAGTEDENGAPNGVFSTTSAQIFVHVAFGIVTLAEAIFLERCVFRLRAERYAHVHPGEVLPRSRRTAREGAVNMGLAPWNRPPLPTYAAALAQSGVGTGDVEDNIIAIPPPPAYGNTRGSTLLLRGFLSDALRAQRPRSDGSRQSRRSSTRSAGSAGSTDEGDDRPKSYMSTDPEWEARCDADRALVLEETLARLEDGHGGSRNRSQ